ncbi:MAG: ABC transporter ATP-binding protein [Candidatus Yonathbacteria bacterium]|nr:ABC transporter ATP-binding protein [Candidatus Yonathbacteria bacterium]
MFNYPVVMPQWTGFIVFLVIVQLVANISDWINDKERRRIGTFIHAEYPARATAHLLRLPLSFHKEYKTGIIWDRFMRAGNALSNIIEQVVINLAPQFLSVAVGVTIAFLIHPLLASVIVIGIMVYVVLLVIIVPPIVKYQRKGNKAWNEAYGDAYDAFANTQTIKQSTGEEYETEKIKKKFINKAATFWYKVEKIWSGIGFYQRMVIAATQLTIFILSVHFIQVGGTYYWRTYCTEWVRGYGFWSIRDIRAQLADYPKRNYCD